MRFVFIPNTPRLDILSSLNNIGLLTSRPNIFGFRYALNPNEHRIGELPDPIFLGKPWIESKRM